MATTKEEDRCAMIVKIVNDVENRTSYPMTVGDSYRLLRQAMRDIRVIAGHPS